MTIIKKASKEVGKLAADVVTAPFKVIDSFFSSIFD